MINRVRGAEKTHYLASTTFTLDKNYSDLKAIGKGSYGVVCSANSNYLGKKVAIKKITPMAKDIVDAKHVLREIRLMRHMGKHCNIISVEDLIVRESHDELYIVMELLDSDLHRILQSKQPLTQNHYQFFFHQLLAGLKYLHNNRIIHRDLKPGNLLVSKDCSLRITDFGLARERPMGKGEDPDDAIDEPMTEHVVTRWYRPPELMLCPDGLYTYAVDMWSCGCILAEMLGRSPLFPGKNFVHQLQLVFDIIGSPENREVSHINNSEALKFLASQHGKKKIPFSRIYPDAPTDAWQLLDDLLVFDPRKRLDVDQALQCPYLFGVGQPESQVYPTVSKEFEFNFEHMKVTKNQLKKLIQQEAQSLRREKNLINDSQANVNTKVIPSFERVQTVGSTDSDSRKETAKKANTEHTEVRAKAKYDNDDVSVTSNRSGRSNSSGRTGYSQRVTSNTANKQSAATLAAQNDCTNRRYSGLMQNTASSALRAASAPRSRLSGVGTKIPTTATRPASNLRQHPGNSDKSQGKQLTENDKGPIKQSSHEQKMETKEATEVTEDSNSVRKSRVGIAYVSVTPKIEQSKSSYVSHERSSKQERENTGTKASDSDEGDAIDSASVYSQHSAGTAGTNATSDRQLRSSKNKLSHVSHRDGVGSPERKSLIQTYMSPTRVVGARNNFEDIQLENNIPELTKTLANAVLSPARDNSSPSAVQPPLPVPNSFAWKVSLVDSNKESELVGMNRVEVSDKELEAIKKSPGRKLVLPYGSPLRRKSTNDQVSANVLPMPPSEVARPLPVPEDQPDRPENATIKKRIITVPKSPKFSLMSWQRKHLGENEHEKVNRSELPKRSSSASRGAYTSTAKANASKPLEKRRSMRLPNGSSRGEGVEQARKMSEKNTKENQELNRRNGAEMYEEAKDSEWNMKKVEELLKGDNNGRRRQAGRAAGVADYNDTASHYSANSRSSSAARTRKK